jgi:hypothetical protein
MHFKFNENFSVGLDRYAEGVNRPVFILLDHLDCWTKIR